MTPRTPAASTNDDSGEPRRWCDPPTAFGKIGVKRMWRLPDKEEPSEVAKFRAAAMQNVICVSIREAKNLERYGRDGNKKLTQEALATLDKRPDGLKKWNAKLGGRMNLSLADLATLAIVLPGAVPPEYEVREFIDWLEGRGDLPEGSRWQKDTSPESGRRRT